MAMGGKAIHVLLVESGQGDAAPLERQLADTDVAQFQLERITRSQVTSDRMAQNHVDVVLLHLSPRQALDVLPRVQEQSPSVPVVVLSDEDDDATAVEEVRGGAGLPGPAPRLMAAASHMGFAMRSSENAPRKPCKNRRPFTIRW